MNPTPAPKPRDGLHLNILAVFHYALAALGAAICVNYVGGVLQIQRAFQDPFLNASPSTFAPPFPFLGCAITAIPAVLNLLSGIFLRMRRARLFSLTVAGLNCLFLPLGTVLGVFTIVLLLRTSVIRLYGENRGAEVA